MHWVLQFPFCPPQVQLLFCAVSLLEVISVGRDVAVGDTNLGGDKLRLGGEPARSCIKRIVNC